MPHPFRWKFAALPLALLAAPAAASSLEDDVLAEINFARTEPRAYARELRRYREQFDGLVVYTDADPDGRMTREGVRAVDEAIRFLEAQRPLEPLDHAPLLARAAGDHAADQGARGGVGHVSSGLTVGRRVQRRGGGSFVSETISYGQRDPVAVVRQLVIDDGVPRRGHRAILFMPWLRYAGVGCGDHATYGAMCVVDFSQTDDGRAPGPQAGLGERVAR
jgi:uncharacterized protein YkwD